MYFTSGAAFKFAKSRDYQSHSEKVACQVLFVEKLREKFQS